ncbi:MAG: efflux RND transporter periplasmic adaptor subunit [Planctomycetes bacterium]|nr:efflux RND transporter periplasmic adaptor subunit [Planctomycetota bacterium]
MPRVTLAIALIAFVALATSGCGGDDDKGGGKPRSKSFPVQTETVEGREVQYVVSAVGSVQAFEEVLITARVAGVIETVNFREGQQVTTETVLCEIEPQRFQYSFDAAKAAHDRAVAELKDANDGLKRREDPKGSIFSKEEVDAWRTKVAVASANEREKAADLSRAELDLKNALPTPPMAGVVQSRLIQTGQWVTPGTVIARLLRRDPMLLRFAVAEDQAGQLKPGQSATFTVGSDNREYKATLTHVAASADQTTRMVLVVGEIDKEDAVGLTPGTFIRATVPVGSRKDAPTVPETAVRASEKGFLVYVIDGGKAYQRVIEIGLRTNDGRIEVKAGLEVGEEIVVRGAEALREGVDVKIVADGEAFTPEARP